ncbi:Protein THP3 [Cyberlindnera fabianii]|uniref:Protein THP3 n=1 Tax=Cyberlindnera fabianii TaxID=36022 RepID=A0A1V2L016_CYBFA|nr:Protein THP3 [Cyberlindnera fabianii]
MQTELKYLIEKANETGKIWKNDWRKQQVPSLSPNTPLELHCNLPHKTPAEKKTATGVRVLNIKRSTSTRNNDEDEMASSDRKKARAERFERELKHTEPRLSSQGPTDYTFDNNQPIKGTCQTLEKSYLRLTSAPDPAKVRPPLILREAFKRLTQRYNEDPNVKYTYVCDQFKAIRQDLTVQLIEDEFTVKVYEAHARIAIENQDLGEFNQCQTVLQKLYQHPHITNSTNKLEFMSYCLIYCLFTKNFDTITALRLKLSGKDKQNTYIAPALEIMKAKFSNNYHLLFKLYSKAKNTMKKLLDCFITNERVRALSVMCTAYKLLSLEFLLEEFHFDNENDCLTFITEKQVDKFIELKGENVYLNTANARSTVMQHLQQTKKVDIKGQV